MKRHLILSFLIVCSICSFAQEKDKKPHIKIGIGAAAGDWANVSDNWEEEWGLGVNAKFVIYNNSSRFSLAPSYIYFPVSEFTFSETYYSTPTSITVNPSMHYINIEGRFAFIKNQKLECNFLLGPSFLIYNEGVDVSSSQFSGIIDDNQFKTGAIGGLGIQMSFTPSLSFYADAGYSYIPDDWDQVLISVGLLFNIF